MDLFLSVTFEKRAEAVMSQWKAVGMSIAVIDHDRTEARAFGYQTLNPKVRSTPETIYDCASTSKSLVAATVAKLVIDDEKYPQVHWDTPVSELLPGEFVLADPHASENATIEDILCHRTGLPRHDLSYVGVRAKNPSTPRSMTNEMRHLAPTAPLAKDFQYNNIMFTVATYLVEQLSGMSWADFLTTHVFEPLGMSSSYVQPSAVYAAGRRNRLAAPYTWPKAKKEYKEIEVVDQPEGQGAGSVQSTVLDYSKWVRAVMTRDETLFKAEVYDELVKPRMITTTKDLDPFTSANLYAFGWEVENYRGYKVVKHDGGVAGYGSVMLFMPELQFGVVIFGNGHSLSSVTRVLSKELIDQRLAVPEVDRVDWNRREEEDEAKNDKENEEDLAKMRKELLESCSPADPVLRRPLGLYCGTYSNAGYHEVVVSADGDRLFIDGIDRTYPCTITFEHICNDVKFVAHITYNDEEETVYGKTEFRIDGDGSATAVGLGLEEDMKDDLIWFDRVADA